MVPISFVIFYHDKYLYIYKKYLKNQNLHYFSFLLKVSRPTSLTEGAKGPVVS